MENLYNKFYMMYGGNAIVTKLQSEVEYIINARSYISEEEITKLMNRIFESIRDPSTKKIIEPLLNVLTDALIKLKNQPTQFSSLHTSVLNAQQKVILELRSNPN